MADPRKWFEMKKADDGASGEIVIYGEIGKSWWDEDSVGAKQFVDDLAALGEIGSLTIRLNSPGGNAFDGIAISNAIKNHPAKSVAVVDGIAASAASIIAMGADTIRMAKNSFMLIHGASGFAMGNADDIRSLADDLDRLDKSIVATYAARAKLSQTKIKTIMKEDRLMDATEAVELGLADEITEEVKLAANYSLRLLSQDNAARFRAMLPTETEADLDPPPVATSQEPEASPEAQPVPTPSPEIVEASNVVALDAARKQGFEDHAAHTQQVADLCTLAGMPELTAEMVKSGKAIEQVRKDLIERKAKRDAEVPLVMPQHPAQAQSQQQSAIKSWDKIVEKVNARLKR